MTIVLRSSIDSITIHQDYSPLLFHRAPFMPASYSSRNPVVLHLFLPHFPLVIPPLLT